MSRVLDFPDPNPKKLNYLPEDYHFRKKPKDRDNVVDIKTRERYCPPAEPNIVPISGLNLDRVNEMAEYLRSLRGHVSKESINSGLTRLVGFKLHDLIEIANNSSSADWPERPGYYSALVIRIHQRLKR